MNIKPMASCLVLAASGCAGDTMNVETKLVGSDFCKIQRQKLSWSTADTKDTIHGIRRFNAKWDKRCGGQTS
ncbi:MAG: hypothetical protein AB7U76_25095 [Pirellulales bacterium]